MRRVVALLLLVTLVSGSEMLSRRLLMGGGSGGAFTLPEPFTVTDRMSSWWTIPRAVEYNGRVYTTGVTEAGGIVVDSVARADHGDTATVTLATHEQDDHNAAALLVPSDQPPLFFYSRHGLDTSLRYRKGSSVGSLASLGAVQTITFTGAVTYAQVWRRPATDEVHVFVRELATHQRYWSNVYTTNYATSWSTPRRVFDFGAGEQGYIGTVATAADANIIRVALTGHPTSSTIHDIYYAEITLSTGDIKNQAGTTLGNLKDGTNLPLTVTSLDKAVDIDTATYNARLMDIGDGPEPEIAYGQWTSDTNMTYHRSVYSGSWSSSQIVAAGVVFGYTASVHYNGGMAFPRDTPGGRVYLSREASGTWYIERRDLIDGSWLTLPIASGSSKLVRPHPIADATAGDVVWHDVTPYPDFETWTGADLIGKG